MENNSDGGDARGRGRGPWRWRGGRGEKEAVGVGAGERLAREDVLPRRPRGGAVRAVISCSSYARLASGGGKLEGRHLLLSGLVSSFALVLLVSKYSLPLHISSEASWETRAGKVGAAGGRGRWTSPMPAWTAWSAMTGSSGGAGSGEEGKRRPRRNELIFLFDWRKEQS
ncbi:hypothetical protein OsJ_07232 [Oryza sativa Japonica Group]|uniref:Uncharacterized protein n=1 Tax=Oryza sativa subsp. japonica TaxID=39947 RepID=B9F0P6_ORYSJ|nr:hypothetical protein OsJ_07232 [Oryza sativa Japonica Group]